MLSFNSFLITHVKTVMEFVKYLAPGKLSTFQNLPEKVHHSRYFMLIYPSWRHKLLVSFQIICEVADIEKEAERISEPGAEEEREEEQVLLPCLQE